MDFLLTVFLLIGISLIIAGYIQSTLVCPPQKIIYKYVPKHPMDIQFGEENKPSDIYKDMFQKPSIYINSIPFASGTKTFVLNPPPVRTV